MHVSDGVLAQRKHAITSADADADTKRRALEVLTRRLRCAVLCCLRV
jgi:hypothetical protein